MTGARLGPAAQAFDAVAERFDERFGAWLSVAAQRRAVRDSLLHLFPVGARLLEIGGGTGEDALWLTERGRHVLLTDASPVMVRVAGAKLHGRGAESPVVIAAERLGELASGRVRSGLSQLDGAFSNFAALNCVSDLSPVARALAQLVRPGGHLALVLFGTASVGEVIVQLLRGNTRAAFRRRARGDVVARLGGRDFVVRYHRTGELQKVLWPWFIPTAQRGIGVFVPPSAAEPWISGHVRLLRELDRLDSLLARPLARFGDHVLHVFVRTGHDAAEDGA